MYVYFFVYARMSCAWFYYNYAFTTCTNQANVNARLTYFNAYTYINA